MPHAQSPIFDRIGKMLHAHFDEVVDEPLPKRWVDLIKYLNEQEREDEARRQRQKTPSNQAVAGPSLSLVTVPTVLLRSEPHRLTLPCEAVSPSGQPPFQGSRPSIPLADVVEAAGCDPSNALP